MLHNKTKPNSPTINKHVRVMYETGLTLMPAHCKTPSMSMYRIEINGKMIGAAVQWGTSNNVTPTTLTTLKIVVKASSSADLA
jgi:hypothetical protein